MLRLGSSQFSIFRSLIDFANCKNWCTCGLHNLNGKLSIAVGKATGGHNHQIPNTHVRWKKNPYPPLVEEELLENVESGGGPGGQSINKTMNCVFLKHVPTGVFVKCQKSRSLHKNKELARYLLQEKLDWHYNGENSIKAREAREASQKKRTKKKESRQRQEKKRAFKEKFGFN